MPSAQEWQSGAGILPGKRRLINEIIINPFGPEKPLEIQNAVS